MARDVDFNYTASDRTGSANDSARHRIKETATMAEKLLGDGFSKGTKKGEAALKRLRTELGTAQRDLKGLALAFANAGTAAERMDISKLIRAQEGEVRRLSKSLKLLEPAAKTPLKDAFTAVADVGPQLIAAGIVAAAPLIGATVSAAIIGGAGLGGVVGGVMLAAQDPRVAAAGTALGQRLLTSLRDDASSFVEPVLAAIGRVGAAFDQLQPRLQRIFSNSSQFLGPLVTGVLRAVDGITAGLDKLIANAGPVMTQLGVSIGQIGTHLGDFFKTVAGGGDEAAMALRDVTNALTLTLDTLGPTTRSLTELYGALDRIGAVSGAFGVFSDIMAKSGSEAKVAGAATQTAAAAITQVGTKATAAAGPVMTFSDNVHMLAESGHAAFDALTSLGEATANARKALKENGKTLDENTAKGRANRTALSNLAQAMVGQYEAAVRVNGEGAKSNKIAGDNRAAFIKLATAFTGSKQKAAELATQMGLIPPKKNTSFTANTHDAEARIKALQDKVNNVHGKTISVHVSVTGTERLNQLGHRIGGFSMAGQSWMAVDSQGGRSRTGGATPVQVQNDISVSLDGAPFHRFVGQAQARQAWRAKVGKR